MSRVITIIGGNGYLGTRCIQTLLNNCRDIKIYSIARNFELNTLNKYDDRVEQIKGNALDPDSFSTCLQKSSGVIHTVGKLLSTEPSSSDQSYDKLNFETAIKVAKLANDFSTLSKKNFVYISAERGLMFPLSLAFSGYIDSKRKAEEKLLKDFPNLNPVILRPGLIIDFKERPYLLPLSYAFDFAHCVEKNIVDKVLPNIGEKVNLPASSIQLDTLAFYAAAGVLVFSQGDCLREEKRPEIYHKYKSQFADLFKRRCIPFSDSSYLIYDEENKETMKKQIVKFMYFRFPTL